MVRPLASAEAARAKTRKTIVSNESSDIIRMFNSAFDGVGAAIGDYYPMHLLEQIDAINTRVYPGLNNGVYRAGFATSQDAYEAAFTDVFDTLDWLEEMLGRSCFLLGSEPMECGWRLFTMLVRFDPVYVGHFKCNLRRIVDYPNLWGYTRDLYQSPGVRETSISGTSRATTSRVTPLSIPRESYRAAPSSTSILRVIAYLSTS